MGTVEGLASGGVDLFCDANLGQFGQIYAESVQCLRNPDSVRLKTRLSFRLSQVAEPGGSLRGLNYEW